METDIKVELARDLSNLIMSTALGFLEEKCKQKIICNDEIKVIIDILIRIFISKVYGLFDPEPTVIEKEELKPK